MNPDLIDLARSPEFALGELHVRPSVRQVTGPAGDEILEPRVMQVLVALASARGEIVSRDELIASCWGGRIVGDDAIQRCVVRLRKLEDVHGGFEIENISRVGYRLTTGAVAQAATAKPSGPVLAVLAFDNLSSDPEMTYFSDGVSGEILHAVSRGLRVIGRASSFQFRGADKAVRKVAAELGATHVLDGSVRRAGDMVRISAQLIEVQGQTTIWQSQYDRPAGDLFAVQDEVAVAVATTLKRRLAPAPPEDVDPATYDDYLRLRQWIVTNHGDRQVRMNLADQVTARVPNFGLGWLQSANAHAGAWRHAPPGEADRLYEKMTAAFARASELLGPNDARLTALVVNWRPWCGAWSACEAHLQQALAGAPNEVGLISVLASLYGHAGRQLDSLALYQDLREREPLSAGLAYGHANTLHAAGLHDESYAAFDAAGRRWPGSMYMWRDGVIDAAAAGRWDVVDRWISPDRIARFHQNPLLESTLGIVETYRNPPANWGATLVRRLADRIEQTGRTRLTDLGVAAYFGDVAAVFDLVDRASFAHLADPRQGYEHDDYGAQSLFTFFARRLRSDPRFVTLCARLGLVTYWLEGGRWPNCADQTLYDFRAECRRVADTPLG